MNEQNQNREQYENTHEMKAENSVADGTKNKKKKKNGKKNENENCK